jgi:pyruvate dehydrogenase E2 component (dihydrolipoamide acetyltransferase)
MKYFSKVNLGLAVDTERGLMVPALSNADDLSITGLSSQLRILAESCRKGNVNPDLLSPEAASFTVSNLGNYGVECLLRLSIAANSYSWEFAPLHPGQKI